MAYFAPYIDVSGIHIPTYLDIREDLLNQARNIFGPDIYLAEDSQDYQYISVISKKMYDTLKTVEMIYNNRSPATAVGSALDTLVKMNGLSRKAPQYSKCTIKLTGDPASQIKNGVVSDISKNKWNIPDVILPETGIIYVTAISQELGQITANIGDIRYIETPMQGWKGVVNETPAEIGMSTESDGSLRSRQAISTAQPSRSILRGTEGAVAAVANIKRYRVYENDTNATDKNTVPPHSICVVAEGGANEDIANAIYLHKGLGCGAYGEHSVNIIDEDNYDYSSIRFCRPVYKDITVSVALKRLEGFTDNTMEKIKRGLTDYCNNIKIGVDLNVSSLWGIIFSVSSDPYRPQFSILSVAVGMKDGEASGEDIHMAYNEVVRLEEEGISIIVN